jgi:hypothetical protein
LDRFYTLQDEHQDDGGHGRDLLEDDGRHHGSMMLAQWRTMIPMWEIEEFLVPFSYWDEGMLIKICKFRKMTFDPLEVHRSGSGFKRSQIKLIYW